MTYKQYWYWLQNIPGIGRKKTAALLQHFASPSGIYGAGEEELARVAGISKGDVKNIITSRNPEKIKEDFRQMEKKGIGFVAAGEERFPGRLRHIYDAPYGMYYRGSLPPESKKAVAIVGARECSAYGREVAAWLGRELAEAGFLVISGLARGIDVCAHRGALSVLGATYAVMGCGIDTCYPPSHIETYMQIMETGGILSEYPVGTPAYPGLFPERNRIISGLSDGIIVVEAKERSGSLISAELALEQGRDVFAVPGRIKDALSAGTNRLISQGAVPVTDAGDVIEYYGMERSRQSLEMKKNNSLLEKEETMVYASLSLMPRHIDEVAKECGLSVTDTMKVLIQMECEGLIRQDIPCYYSKKMLKGME